MKPLSVFYCDTHAVRNDLESIRHASNLSRQFQQESRYTAVSIGRSKFTTVWWSRPCKEINKAEETDKDSPHDRAAKLSTIWDCSQKIAVGNSQWLKQRES